MACSKTIGQDKAKGILIDKNFGIGNGLRMISVDSTRAPTGATPLLETLSNDSFVVLRDVVSEPTRLVFSRLQSLVDVGVGNAVSMNAGVFAPLLAARHTIDPDQMNRFVSDLTGDEFDQAYFRMVEEITTPLLREMVGEVSWRRTYYGGMFVSDPRLPRVSNFHWHSDGHFDGLDEAGVNFWIPLRACGADAPSITVVRADERALTHDLAGLPQVAQQEPTAHTAVDWPRVTDQHLRSVYGADRLHTPQFDFGDVLVFTSRCIHRTDFLDSMRIGRGAIIIRYLIDGRPRLI